MSRWVLALGCILLGLLLLVLGWLVPLHLRAVDSRLLQRAGKNTPSLIDQGISLLNEKRLGAAQLISQAADAAGLPDRQRLGYAITNLAGEHPEWVIWGGGESHLEVLFRTDPKLPKATPEPFTEWVVRLDNRDTMLHLLEVSSRPVVRELFLCRTITNTTVFPPSLSASGQAFDAALSICALLSEEGSFTSSLSNSTFHLAVDANRGKSQGLEELLLDLMSLGQRLNWAQLATFVARIDDPETLRRLAA